MSRAVAFQSSEELVALGRGEQGQLGEAPVGVGERPLEEAGEVAEHAVRGGGVEQGDRRTPGSG